MSTDYDVACDACKVFHHFGQFMGGVFSMGYGSKDAEGRENALKFIDDHSACADSGLRILNTEAVPEDYTEVEEDPKCLIQPDS